VAKVYRDGVHCIMMVRVGGWDLPESEGSRIPHLLAQNPHQRPWMLEGFFAMPEVVGISCRIPLPRTISYPKSLYTSILLHLSLVPSLIGCLRRFL
jgi:hypothetical protein